MPLTLSSDSTTRSVSAGILAENKQPQPLADASGYKVSAGGLTPLRSPDSFLAARSLFIILLRVNSPMPIPCNRKRRCG